MSIDIKSVTTSQLQIFFDDQKLALGTGFFYEEENNYYLVTNWHNVTGRDPFTLKPLDKDNKIPNHITLSLNLKGKLGSWIEFDVPLYEDTKCEQVRWFVHPQYIHAVDVVVIPLKIPAEVIIYAVNNKEISKTPDMRISIAQDVFVLGYPRGLSGGGLFPIWKRATIATEPDVQIDGLPKMFIDTATREGMSGAPVYAISNGVYQDTQGNSNVMAGGGVLFVGIYSGRNIGKTEIEAQLGIVWKPEVIKMIIKAKQVGVSSFKI